MLNSRLSLASIVGVVLFVFVGLCRPCGVTPAAAAPEEKAKAGEGASEKGSGGQAPAADLTPKADNTPEAAAAATQAAQATLTGKTCKKAVADFGSGNSSALDTFPAEKRAALVQASEAVTAFTCLAIANDNGRYCEALPKPKKNECLERFKLTGELKALPKERMKAVMIHQVCMTNGSKADCDTVREAITNGDAAKCKVLSEATLRDFCAGLASGDPSKCTSLPQGEDRSRCEAYVTDDPSRCLKDSVDCRNMAGVFAKVKKQGLEGAEAIDPAIAAARKGKQACTPLLADLERFCAEQH